MGCAAGLALSLNSVAKAQTTPFPTGDIIVNGTKVDVSDLFQFNPEAGIFFIAPTSLTFGPDLSVTFGVNANPDPFISYSFAASNFTGGTVPFAADFFLPIGTPLQVGSTVNASVGYSITDATGDGVTLTPNSGSPYNAGFTQNTTGDGVDLGLDLGSTFSGTGVVSTFTKSFNGSGVTPFAINSFIDIHLAFTLTGNSDTAGITGAVVITDVPEPGSVALIAGLSLSGGAFLLRRKRSLKHSA